MCKLYSAKAVALSGRRLWLTNLEPKRPGLILPDPITECLFHLLPTWKGGKRPVMMGNQLKMVKTVAEGLLK